MNRREFLKMMGMLPLFMMLRGEPVYSYSELMLKVLDDLANDRKPTELDRENLRLMLDDIDNIRRVAGSWVTPDGKVNPASINLPFFPLITSRVFDADVSELIVEPPDSFNHLFLIGQFRTSDAANQDLEIQFNDDTGANYKIQRLSGAFAVASAGSDLSYTGMHLGVTVPSTAAAGESGWFVAFIPHYRSAFYKTMINLEGVFRAAASAGTAIWASQWVNASIVKKMRIHLTAGNIKAGSMISIYGIQ